MRDFHDAKAMVQTLRDELKAKGVSLTHSDVLELVAKTLGFQDWNTLAAKIQSERRLPDTGPATDKPAREEIAVDATILDGYDGFYQRLGDTIMAVTRDGSKLFKRLTGQRSVPIYPESNTEFFAKVVDAQISFVTNARGAGRIAVSHQGGRDMPMKRIDAAAAQQIEDKRTEKLKSQSPSSGTEAALRRLVDGLLRGEPNYEEMSSEMVQATRDQLADLHAGLAPFGAVQSIRFLGVGNQSEDVYVVKQERGEVHHW